MLVVIALIGGTAFYYMHDKSDKYSSVENVYANGADDFDTQHSRHIDA